MTQRMLGESEDKGKTNRFQAEVDRAVDALGQALRQYLR